MLKDYFFVLKWQFQLTMQYFNTDLHFCNYNFDPLIFFVNEYKKILFLSCLVL